jgi:hypothetical protein
MTEPIFPPPILERESGILHLLAARVPFVVPF